MKQQTAVQWLVDHFKKLQSDGEKMSWNQIIQIVELAKKKEHQRIVDAYDQGNWDAASHKPDVINGKIYFTQTYEQ